ncbi:putative ribonuclease H-like domain-containing protein [Tanacetum coccineum]|uniref:Ribonuclease H-like domain-containing protein n=1 Tax=Tanacetum coccineum TaxID=301880 RepID=A0ABQ5IIM8_9ASTR
MSFLDIITKKVKPKQQQQLIPTTTTILNIKLPILKKEEYDIWAIEMEHYLEYIDNDVWKVIQNGNSKKRISTGKDGVIRVLPPVSAAEIHAVEKERKARTILLMAIPKEHLRRFHGMDDAKRNFEKQIRTCSEGLKKGYDRFQQLFTQLEAYGAEVSTEDANHNSTSLKLGTILPKQQQEIDESLYVYGKKGPQKHKTSVSDDKFNEYSTCQSNDSAGSFGNTSEHSVEFESEIISVPKEVSESKSVTTNEKVVSEPKPKEVKPSCVTHVKTPRQPVKNQETPKVNRKNWNEMMERELGEGYSFIKKKCFVCGSLSHLIRDCDFYEKKMAREAELKKQRVFNTGNGVAKPVWNNANRVNHANHFVPRPVQLNAVRPNSNSVRPNVNTGRANVNSVRQNVNSVRSNVNTVRPKQPVPTSNSNSFSPVRPQVNKFNQRSNFSKSHSPVRRPIVRKTAKMPYSHTVKGNWGTAVKTSAGYNWRNTRPNSNCNSGSNFVRTDHPLKNMEDRGIFDSGCSAHMTGNKDHLDDFEECKGGSVTFGGSKGYITGKGRIRVGNLEFDSVSFVKELGHFNLFSISQICDKQHKVLFTETECLVVSPDFKMPDENQILLKVPRQHNMYSFDMKTPAPTKDYACLIAKATSDESKLWHRRLGHINFKNLNKLVKGNLVRGLPSKVFRNDHTCVACQKGKQHKASCKAKLERTITEPLHTLHMDLFGPTSVKSINHASYCLVITDDCTRFSWVFFLATKDETSGILQNFIRQIENQLNHRVKIIRSDNGTEFKNRDMLEFCGNKGIKQEYSNARTPQQNGVAERMNMTLIEAARTMLADSLLPTTFWAEAVSTACYIFNRVRVTKPQNKTPYELLFGHKPIISYIRPFGCHVTILDTLSVLGKFDGKCDEGFLVGYSLNSKAFRVYNLVTKKVEVNLHVKFLEEKPNVKGVGTLQTPYANAYAEEDEAEELIVVPTEAKHTAVKVELRKSSTNSKAEEFLTELQNLKTQEKEAYPTGISEDTPEILAFRRELDELAQKHLREVPKNKATSTTSVNSGSGPVNSQHADQDDSDMPELTIFNKPQKGIFDEASYDDEGMVHDFNNLPTEVAVSPILTLRIHNIHPQSQIFGDPKSSVQIRSKVQQHSGAHALQNVMNPLSRLPYGAKVIGTNGVYRKQKGMKRGVVVRYKGRLGQASQTDEEVYVSQPPGFVDPDHPKKVYKCDKFEALMKGRFQMSSMGELIFFLGLQVKQKTDGLFISQDKYVADLLKKFDLASLKTAITPMETKMALTKMRKLMMWMYTLHIDLIVATSTTEAEYVAAAIAMTSVVDSKSNAGLMVSILP